MTERSCEEIQNVLVDYVDRERSEHDSQAVAQHLAGCPACREIVSSLERSLVLTRVIWLDNLKGSKVAPAAMAARMSAIHRLRRVAVAAGILITGGVFLFSAIRQSAEQPLTYGQIEQRVTRAAAAARLLAATRILATCEGTKSAVEQQCRYILSNYPDTPAASELQADASSLLKGAPYD